MKRKYLSLLLATTFMMSGTTVFASEYTLPFNNMEVIHGIDKNGEATITFTVPKDEMELYLTKEQDLMQPPKVGEVLGTIYKENGEKTEFYSQYDIGQCVGYARARFEELHQIQFPYMGNAKYWIQNHYRSTQTKMILDLDKLQEKAIAVYKPTEELKTMAGHLVIIEYIERDEKGNLMNVYYTDSNTLGEGIFYKEHDGKVKKMSIEEFKNPYGLKLLGYIVPDERAQIEETTLPMVNGYMDVTGTIDPITGKVDPNIKTPYGSQPTMSYGYLVFE